MNITYKARSTPTSKAIGMSIIIVDFVLSWFFVKTFWEYILNILRLKLDFYSIIITGGFSFMLIIIFLASRVFFTPGEYVLTDNELIIRTLWIIKYAEQRIPYSDIENVFLYVLWDFRGNANYLVLVKKYGKLDVNIMYPTQGTLLLLNVESPRQFVQDLASFAKIYYRDKDADATISKVNKVMSVEGVQFTYPTALLILVTFVFSLLIASPVILLAVHVLVKPTKVTSLSLDFLDLSVLSLLISVIAIVFVPIALNMFQRYLLTREGLYIKKLLATIFIPRSVIKGFVYIDINEKSGQGGGLLKIGNMTTIVSTKQFKKFLNTMEQYRYILFYKSARSIKFSVK